jgi:hypothetical protein
MPPAPHEYRGIDAIAAFLRASFTYDCRIHLVPAAANGQVAYGSYLGAPVATPAGLIVLTMAGDRIQHITRFHTDALYPRFGLPMRLTAP